MSRYWNYTLTLTAGNLARAEDINTLASGIDAGFTAVVAEMDQAIRVTESPGTVAVTLNATARANKILAFDANGDIAVSNDLGSWKGAHADAAGTVYNARDIVRDDAGSIQLGSIYICSIAHTSTGSLLTDTANWELLIDATDLTTLGGLTSSQYLRSDAGDVITTGETTTRALDITETALTSGDALRVHSNNSSKSGQVAHIHQDHASSAANGLLITNDGTGIGELVDVTGNAKGISVQRNVASATVNLVEVTESNASASGACYKATHNGTGDCVSLRHNLSGDALYIDHRGAGASLNIDHFGVGGNVISATANNASRTSEVVRLHQDHASSSSPLLSLVNDGSGYTLVTFTNLASAVGGRFYSNAANRTAPVVQIIADNATGSGDALSIQQDQSAPHIVLSGANGEGIKFPATASLSTDANTLDDYQEGTFTAILTPTTSGTITLSADTISYTVIGDRAFISGTLVVSSVSSPVGTYVNLTGIPTAIQPAHNASTPVQIINLSSALAGASSGTIVSGTSTLVIQDNDGSAVTSVASKFQATVEVAIEAQWEI